MRHGRAVEYEESLPPPPHKPAAVRAASWGLILPVGLAVLAAIGAIILALNQAN
jgi:hypothetical protein